jgi:hypothetical protein
MFTKTNMKHPNTTDYTLFLLASDLRNNLMAGHSSIKMIDFTLYGNVDFAYSKFLSTKILLAFILALAFFDF